MDFKPILKNRIFQAVGVVAVATLVLTGVAGFVIGKAITLGLLVGAGYIAYKYILEPLLIKKQNSIGMSTEDIKKYSNHYYDKDAIEKEIKAQLKNSGTFKR